MPPPGLMDCSMPAVGRASGCMGTECITIETIVCIIIETIFHVVARGGGGGGGGGGDLGPNYSELSLIRTPEMWSPLYSSSPKILAQITLCVQI